MRLNKKLLVLVGGLCFIFAGCGILDDDDDDGGSSNPPNVQGRWLEDVSGVIIGRSGRLGLLITQIGSTLTGIGSATFTGAVDNAGNIMLTAPTAASAKATSTASMTTKKLADNKP